MREQEEPLTPQSTVAESEPEPSVLTEPESPPLPTLTSLLAPTVYPEYDDREMIASPSESQDTEDESHTRDVHPESPIERLESGTINIICN